MTEKDARSRARWRHTVATPKQCSQKKKRHASQRSLCCTERFATSLFRPGMHKYELTDRLKNG